MGSTIDDETVARLLIALERSARPPTFPEVMDLPDVVAELTRWLDDDRQWHHANAASWKSLLAELSRSVRDCPPDVRRHVTESDVLCDEIELCRVEAADKNLRREALLRRRLTYIRDRLVAGLTSEGARRATWSDFVRRSGEPEQAVRAARRLMALARWAGSVQRCFATA